MESQIYDIIKEKKTDYESEKHENFEKQKHISIENIVNKKDADLSLILSEVNLLENVENEDIISLIGQYSESIFEKGILVGLIVGEDHIIEKCKNNELSNDEINTFNPGFFAYLNHLL